jgi:hypothetical protein
VAVAVANSEVFEVAGGRWSWIQRVPRDGAVVASMVPAGDGARRISGVVTGFRERRSAGSER